METAISVSRLHKNFGAKPALNGVSFDVPRGSIYGFLGPNGAGKTTTIRCLMDYLHPSGGSAQILGLDAQNDSAALKASIGYLSSEMQLHDEWTAGTHIDFLSRIKGRGRASELVKLLDLDLKPKVRELSSGNKQKLAIVLAFLGDPKLLIMDEPTRGLDPLLQNQLYELLRDFSSTGGTVFLSSHNLAEVQQLCSTVALIRAGKIVEQKSMADLLQLQLHILNATTTKPIKPATFKLPGVQVLEHDHTSLSLKISGPINPVIRVLTDHELIDLQVNHASLEDIFLEYY